MSFAPHFPIRGACKVSPIVQPANTGEHSFSHMGSQRCCEHGRVIVTDPSSSLAVCACQMKMSSSHTFTSRVPSLPETLFGSATSHFYPSAGLLGPEPSAFYPMKNLSHDGLKTASASDPFYINNLLATHSYGSFYPGLDLNHAARRKNATRETTSALKEWLYEHRKNPYPTKGEKIMLAIITRMTLTQVSTWFANARRRLKKETKMGWSIRDGEDDNDCDGSEQEDGNGRGSRDSSSSRFSTSDEEEVRKVSDISDVDDEIKSTNKQTSSKHLERVDVCSNGRRRMIHVKSSMDTLEPNIQRDSHVTSNSTFHFGDIVTQTSSRAVSQDSPQNCFAIGTGNCRPKIWSISEIIGSKNDPLNALTIGSENVFSSINSVESSGSDTISSCADSCSQSGTKRQESEDDGSSIV
ncbi:hypothetical protein CHS0354_033860 [Potamilus streckersoni]|uniref:Homeobox domain-containing protein n=1 Tax=Potamilus streckersoni TaxID=2493646 RepID=A0AAE0VLC9_9BIVA|nr:hypothetical protein CHS0354_033860 [Potamilus streckersoni]